MNRFSKPLIVICLALVWLAFVSIACLASCSSCSELHEKFPSTYEDVTLATFQELREAGSQWDDLWEEYDSFEGSTLLEFYEEVWAELFYYWSAITAAGNYILPFALYLQQFSQYELADEIVDIFGPIGFIRDTIQLVTLYDRKEAERIRQAQSGPIDGWHATKNITVGNFFHPGSRHAFVSEEIRLMLLCSKCLAMREGPAGVWQMLDSITFKGSITSHNTQGGPETFQQDLYLGPVSISIALNGSDAAECVMFLSNGEDLVSRGTHNADTALLNFSFHCVAEDASGHVEGYGTWRHVNESETDLLLQYDLADDVLRGQWSVAGIQRAAENGIWRTITTWSGSTELLFERP